MKNKTRDVSGFFCGDRGGFELSMTKRMTYQEKVLIP